MHEELLNEKEKSELSIVEKLNERVPFSRRHDYISMIGYLIYLEKQDREKNKF